MFECATFISDETLKTKLIRNMTHDLNLQVQKSFDLAMSLLAMYTLTILKLSDDYNLYIPSCIQDKWVSYGINILEIIV